MYKENNLIINKTIIYNNESYRAIDITIDGHLVLKKEEDIIIVTSNEITLVK